jgi:hypothetical protein
LLSCLFLFNPNGMETFEGQPFVNWQKEWRGDSLEKEVGPKGKLCTLNLVFFLFRKTTWAANKNKKWLSIYAGNRHLRSLQKVWKKNVSK